MLNTLYKYYPEMEEIINKLYMHSPNYFKKENAEVKQISETTFNIHYKYDNSYTKVGVEICGNELKAKAGALPGNGEYDSQLNEFLNYLLPNKEYIVDDCFVYETDRLGRVYKAQGDLTKATYLQRRKDRDQRYQLWVKEMDGHSKDEGGHIFANRFNGPSEKINIVPMNSEWQHRGGVWYEEVEEQASNYINEGKQVQLHLELLYKGNNKRPYAFKTQIRTNRTIVFDKILVNPD